jgi:DNA-binding SARP family transcriptional activator/TolB-like protein
MLRLNLLGAVDLRNVDGRPCNGDVGGTKYLALLLYLVLEGAHRPVRRDKVIGVLWPDSEQEKARQSLSQALYKLRTALGDVVISGGQEELSVDRTRISTDSFEFRDLASAGQLEEAVALYRGDVADGLNVKEIEFDQWLAGQRATWRDHIANVLRKLFDDAIQTDDLTRAAAWAEKLLDIAAEKDEPVRKLIPLLVAREQPAAAKHLYDKYERTLANTFDTAPPAEIADLIASLPQGLRSRRASHARSIQIGEPVTRGRGSLTTALATIAAVVGLVLGTMWYLSIRSRASLAAYEDSPPKVAVLPFAYGESTQRSAAVLNEALQWRLRNVGFEVLNAGSQDTTAIRKLVTTAGKQSIRFVVGGDVATAADGSLAARLWLNDAGNGKRVWESRFTQPASDAHLIATELSDAITTQIRRAAGSVLELTPGAAKVSRESWKDVYRARERMEASYAMRRQGAVSGSVTELKDAELSLIGITEREPDWPLPWVLRARIAEALAFTALISGDPKQGGVQLDRGIRMLDSVATRLHSEDIYEMRGLLQYRRFAWGVDDVATANRLLTRAEADLRKAAGPGRDPSGSLAMLSGVMFAQGKYAEAFVYARRAYDSNVFLRNNEEVLTRLFNSALHAGDDASAEYWCNELQTAQHGKWPAVLCRVHIAGFAPTMVDFKGLEHEIESVAASPPIRLMMAPRLRAAYAITLAQIGQADSARATLNSVAGSKDPEVMLFSAFALAVLKDAPQAHAALRNYLAEYRGTRSTALHMRWLN